MYCNPSNTTIHTHMTLTNLPFSGPTDTYINEILAEVYIIGDGRRLHHRLSVRAVAPVGPVAHELDICALCLRVTELVFLWFNSGRCTNGGVMVKVVEIVLTIILSHWFYQGLFQLLFYRRSRRIVIWTYFMFVFATLPPCTCSLLNLSQYCICPWWLWSTRCSVWFPFETPYICFLTYFGARSSALTNAYFSQEL